jgi:hypothetical protein
MAAPKKTGAGAPKFTLNASLLLTESEGKSLLKRRDQKTDAREITVQPAANAGLWAVGDYTQQNGFDVTLSSGFTSREEALNAAQAWLLTGKESTPKSEPAPIWLDPEGNWQLLSGTGLWPLAPNHTLLELRWVGDGPAPDGCGLLLRLNELDLPLARKVKRTYESGLQPRVSIVERRVMGSAMFFKVKSSALTAQL